MRIYNRFSVKPKAKYFERRIKLIHVISKFETGGMENGIINICNSLDRNKFEPVVCCVKGLGDMSCRLAEDVKTFNLKSRDGKVFNRFFIMAMFFLKQKPLIVHTHGWGGCSMDAIVGARIANVPVVINGEHGGFFLKKYQVFAQNISSLLCNRTLAVSESLKTEIVVKLKVKPERIFVIPNGVNNKVFHGGYNYYSLERELNDRFQARIDKGTDFIIGSIGSLKPEKNQIMLLNAVNQINNKYPNNNIKVLIIGKGDNLNKLRDFVINHNMENQVLFLGERIDIPVILSYIDLLVSTSLSFWEGMSNVILEAMSSKVPVIATESVGNKELIINSENGFLIGQDDVQQLSNKILFLLSDKVNLEVMGRKAKAMIDQKYALEMMIRNYSNCYIDLLQNHT